VIRRYRALVELVLAFAALVGAGVSWSHARHTVGVAPIADGQPFTTSLVYEPKLLLLTMVLVTTAGVLAVVGTARLRRERQLARPSSR
jgi:NO-binding membrane sensor protein with MHYT domain